MSDQDLPESFPVRASAQPEDVSARFREAWTRMLDPSSAAVEMLPVRLARACVMVLPVDGAGVSLFNGNFRVPLGASDDDAGCAELLQFTQGEGPCLAAGFDGRTGVSGSEELERRWPQYASELFEQTPYRAVMSVPLSISKGTRGALDLFLRDEQQLASLSLVDAATVAERVVEALALADSIARRAAPETADLRLPGWLLAPSAQRREDVWIAMGIAMGRHEIRAADALSLLRAYAYSNDLGLDDVADQLLRGVLDVDALYS